MPETTRNFMLGLTTLAAAAGLMMLLLLFGELDRIIKPRYEITIHTNDAADLRTGSAIELNGVPVGVVLEVSRESTPADEQYPVELVISIDEHITIPGGVKLRTSQNLLGGGATLHLDPPAPGTAGPDLPTDGTATLAGRVQTPLEQLAAELELRMQPLIELSRTLTGLGGELSELITKLEPDVSAAVENFNRVLTEAEKVAVGLNRWINDDQFRANAQQLVAKAAVAADELSLTLEQFRLATTKATEGKGTVAQLLNNPDLYRSLNDAAIRLEQALLEIQLFVEKTKAEGLHIR